MSAVWGTAAPATAGGNVYTYICGLRRDLGPGPAGTPTRDIVVSGRSGYCLRLDDDVSTGLDARRFERMQARATALLGQGDHGTAAALLGPALALWYGEAYAGLSGAFIELERQRLAELRLLATEQLAGAMLEQGAGDEAAAELAGLVRDHPLRESLHELLMLARYRTGRPAEALDAFRQARRALVTELGVEPGSGLRQLHHRILAETVDPPGLVPAVTATMGRPRLHSVPSVQRYGATGQHATGPGTGPQPAAGGREPVGRQPELGVLRGAVREVVAGRGGAVWIVGEPGIGKTELLTAALATAAVDGCRIVRATADELGRRVLLNGVAGALGLETTDQVATTAAVADQLLDRVRRACAAGPVIVAVDDLHWADEVSLHLWDRLCVAARHLPLLLLSASRREPNGRQLARLRRCIAARGGRIMDLGPLREPDLVALVTRVPGGIPGPVARRLAAQAAGNPRYAIAAATEAARTGSAGSVDAVPPVEAVAVADPAAADEAPGPLLEQIRAGLFHLSRDTMDVLRSAALLGTRFGVAELAAVSGLPPRELLEPLGAAIADGVVVAAGDQLAFRHPYLRAAVLDGIPKAVRTALHQDLHHALQIA